MCVLDKPESATCKNQMYIHYKCNHHKTRVDRDGTRKSIEKNHAEKYKTFITEDNVCVSRNLDNKNSE